MSRNTGLVLDIKDRAIITEWLIKFHERQEKSSYYEKSPDISWKQHIGAMGHTPWDGIHEASGEILCNEFVGDFLKTASVDDWWNAEYISLEQAVALTFGKEPTEINWKILNNLCSVPIAISMQKFAIRMQATLFHNKDRIEFIKLLEWLSCNQIENMDKKFIESIIARRHDFVDWKVKYNSIKESYDVVINENIALKEELIKVNDKMHGSSRKSFYGMFAGLLALSYGAKTIVSNEVKASEINGDILEKSGVDITDEVVRNYIQEVIPILEKHLKVD